MNNIFISYSSKDRDWVKHWLLPKLEGAGLETYIDYRDFEVGIPSMVNMERAVNECQKTLLVLTPDWVNSQWTNFEALMLQTKDPIGLNKRIIPLMVKKCDLPARLSIFTYADFKDETNWDSEMSRLLDQLGAPGSPTPVKSTASPSDIPLSGLPATGTRFGKYVLGEKLGRGGKGVVLKVMDTLEGKPKAIKIIPHQIADSPLYFKGLQREVNNASGIIHPNVVKVLGLEEQDGHYFIVMEYIPGHSLEQMLADSEDGRLNEQEVLEIMKKVAQGLAETHKNRVIHRDIKPSNVMVTTDRQVKILDFGISYQVTKSMTQLVGEDQPTGTWPYMAPEQLSTRFGRENEQVDIWGFGVTMYQLLTGQLPFQHKEQIKDKNEKPFDMEGVSEMARHIVMKCLEKERNMRFKNMAEVLAAFSETSKSAAVSAVESKARREYENDKGFREADYGDGITMVYIPPGKFTMGSNEYDREKPPHSVELDGYWMGKYAVTFDQYDIYCEETKQSKPDDKGWGRGNRPVINVSWQEVADYCKWLSGKTGGSFKLPTEAQWEKAARGTDGRKYPWGEQEPDKNLANFKRNIGKTSPVGSYPQGASPYGLMDMAGNVWEWCGDWYGGYSFNPQINPTGPAKGSDRVIRGGSWDNDATVLRCASRFNYDPSLRFDYLGFRLCQENK